MVNPYPSPYSRDDRNAMTIMNSTEAAEIFDFCEGGTTEGFQIG